MIQPGMQCVVPYGDDGYLDRHIQAKLHRQWPWWVIVGGDRDGVTVEAISATAHVEAGLAAGEPSRRRWWQR
jgi:hypothetical protein